MKITIIGAGNIGSAIASGLYSSGAVEPSDITCTDLNANSLERLQKKCPLLHVSRDNKSAVQQSDAVLVAVKPWIAESVVTDIKTVLNPQKQIFLSVVANTPISRLNEFLGNMNIPIFRVVPNIAIEVRSSMTFIASAKSTPELDQKILNMFNALGESQFIKEDLISAGTAMASCGIAFALRYIRAASEAGVELGFYPEQAKEIAMMAAKGAIDIIKSHGTNPEEEIDKVTTPGGITIKGLNAMEMSGFTNSVIKGIFASACK